MQTKLTLRIEDKVIRAAKKYSKNHGKSLSQLVADYLSLLTELEDKSQKEELAPITQSLKGILTGEKASEKQFRKHLEEKYR